MSRAPSPLRTAGVLILGLVAPLLDSTIVNVALRTLGKDLNVSVSAVQWVATGYLLAMAVATPVSGWATERFGGRRVWLAALTAFLVGSVLSGAAWDLGSLIAFRLLQGAGTGLMLPLMQTLLFRSEQGRPSGKILALVGLPPLVGPVLGPVIGGLILDHLSWRWIFYVNPPVCLVAILAAMRWLPVDAATSARRLDRLGLVLLPLGLASVIFGLSRVADEGGFGRPMVAVPVAGGLALLAAFVVHALHAQDPLVDVRLFRARGFAVATTLFFLSGLAMFSAMLLLPLYYQQVRGMTVLQAGLLLAPQGLGTALSRGVLGAVDRLGTRAVVLVGSAAAVLGTVPFALTGGAVDPLLLSAALVLRGLGLGTVLMGVMLSAYDGLTHEQIPHASGLTRIAQQVGGSFGTALLAVVLQRQLAGHPGVAGVQAGFGDTFAWSVVLAAVAAAPALLLPGRTAAAPATTTGEPAGHATPAAPIT